MFKLVKKDEKSIPNIHSYKIGLLVIANSGRVLKKQVSGFEFKKPGYLGRILGFHKFAIWRFLVKISHISLEIAKLALFGPQKCIISDIPEFLQ